MKTLPPLTFYIIHHNPTYNTQTLDLTLENVNRLANKDILQNDALHTNIYLGTTFHNPMPYQPTLLKPTLYPISHFQPLNVF